MGVPQPMDEALGGLRGASGNRPVHLRLRWTKEKWREGPPDPYRRVDATEAKLVCINGLGLAANAMTWPAYWGKGPVNIPRGGQG